MEEQKKLEEPLKEDAAEESDESKRQFVTKLVTAVGAVAAAGLVASTAGDPAEAALFIKFQEHKVGAAQFKFDKEKSGFRIVLSGAELGGVLSRSGLLGEDANTSTARITIEFTY